MRVVQRRWTTAEGWSDNGLDSRAQLVFAFGAGNRLQDAAVLAELADACPQAQLFGCSTSGEIAGTQIFDDSIVATSVAFDNTHVQVVCTPIADESDSRRAGGRLADQLSHKGLAHVFLLSDGLFVNGSQLVDGLTAPLSDDVTITGGLAGDGTRFEQTLVLCGQTASPRMVAAVGFYGPSIRVGCASLGGWDPFGPERIVTKSSGNVLFELDGQSALALYKRYLGEHANELPASGLLFPLSMRVDEADEPTGAHDSGHRRNRPVDDVRQQHPRGRPRPAS